MKYMKHNMISSNQQRVHYPETELLKQLHSASKIFPGPKKFLQLVMLVPLGFLALIKGQVACKRVSRVKCDSNNDPRVT